MKKILIGLGNPGKEYENTYHNVGFLALEKMMTEELGVKSYELRKKYKNLFEHVETEDAVFVRPLTYMNDSGKAVRAALKKFAPSSLVILHDDSDLTIGKYKTSFARSSAGHKGVQSIIDALKTNAFTRIRIGIRPVREVKRQKAGEFALKQINARDKKLLDAVMENIEKSWKTL